MLLRDGICKALRQAILTGALPPGQALREQALVEKYGVSHSPIRESLLRLEQENLVTVLPRQGYLVRSITASDVEDMLHLRSLVEPVCTAAAAGADDAAVQALDRFRGFPDHDFTASSYTDYNEAFHHSVADLSDNKRMGGRSRWTSSSSSRAWYAFWSVRLTMKWFVATAASMKRSSTRSRHIMPIAPFD